jgi:peroxiredoxin
LSGIDGKSYSLFQNGARLTLAVFFKTTCPTCQLTWPYLERLHQSYRGAGLAVWGISQDARDLSAAYASKYHSTFPILVDADWRVSRIYDPQFVPTLFLISDEGQVVETVVAFDKAKLNHLSQTIAGRLGVPPVMVAPPEDGAPAFRPG